jgi:hypothetical protein
MVVDHGQAVPKLQAKVHIVEGDRMAGSCWEIGRA